MDSDSSTIFKGDNLPKGPTIIALWCKEDGLSKDDQAELLHEAANLITAKWVTQKSENIEVEADHLVRYLNLEHRIANLTIHRALSELR